VSHAAPIVLPLLSYQVLASIAIVTLAALCQSAAGFGFSLIAVPLLVLVLPPRVAVVVGFLHGCTLSLVVLNRYRRVVDLRETLYLSIGAIALMPLGLLVLLSSTQSHLRLTLGIVTIGAAVLLVRDRVRQIPTGRAFSAGLALGAGALSGFLNTSLSTNGPPLVAYLQLRGFNPDRFRGTISAVFTVSNLVGLGLFVGGGVLSPEAFEVFIATLPGSIVGGGIGLLIGRRVSARAFGLTVDLLLILGGVLAILKAVS